ncbi:MAG: homocysteine S-methyltransferase family protein, partial [Bacteroidota bacterium]|nr:homocysteine S-methyltransferase family protein [Bacteroidota bacterium]
MKKSIDEIIKDKTIFLKVVSNNDVRKYGLKERDYQGQRYSDNTNLMDFYEILSITKPDVVSEVYERFLKAGVDIIVTNTAKANRFHLKKKGLDDITYELNLESTKIARSKVTKYSSIVRDKKRFLGGTMSNLSKEIDFETAEAFYSEQVKAL